MKERHKGVELRRIIFCSTVTLILVFYAAFAYAQAEQTVEIPFQERITMVGGNYKLISEDSAVITLQGEGEIWVSLPVNIGQGGLYKITVVKDGGGLWDMLIDGERHAQLNNISLANNGENVIPFPIYLDEGQHSLIFYASNNQHLIHKWRSLKIEKLNNKPDKYIDARQHWLKINNFSRILKIGDMFSGSYVNVNIARDMAIFSRGGYQFISYYHPEGYLVVGKRKLDSTHFEKYWIPISVHKAAIFPEPSKDFYLSDPHHFISMQMDGAGYIHLAFGHHNNKMKYLRSKYPGQIFKWDIPEGNMENGEDEKKVTYVRFLKLKSGNLLAAFRIGWAGHGYARLLTYDIKTKKWSRQYSPFITDYGHSSPYFWRPVISAQGVIHLAWTWRLSAFDDLEADQMRNKYFSGFFNQNISYAKSYDEGKTWLRSDNSEYALPIDRRSDSKHKAEVIENIPMGESFFNHYGSDYDREGRSHFTYTRWGDAINRIPQQWHLYWNGKVWQSVAVTNYSKRFHWTRPQQNGRASTYLVRPSILLANDNAAIIISRSREFNNVIEFYISQDSDYKIWEKIIAYRGSVGGWEPQMDLDLWHETNNLQLLLLGITDKVIKQHYLEKVYKKRSIFSKAKSFFKRRKKNTHNYYSSDLGVTIMRIDRNLKEDIGYILEIDYGNLNKQLSTAGQ